LLKLSLTGAFLVAVTVAIHAAGSTPWVRFLVRRHLAEDGSWRSGGSIVPITSTVLVLVFLHAIEITVWAAAYRVLVPDGQLPSFETALYFSFVTFTTLGYGDITLGEGWRLLSGIQALNGILLVGWTTALLFGLVQRTWRA
jgi:hypothetical protein